MGHHRIGSGAVYKHYHFVLQTDEDVCTSRISIRKCTDEINKNEYAGHGSVPTIFIGTSYNHGVSVDSDSYSHNILVKI